MLEFLNNYPCSVNLERDYEKMQANLQIFRNVSINLLKLFADDLKNLTSLFSEISRIVDTRTGASERNEARDGQMEEEKW